MPATTLPGLDRLLETARKYSFPVETLLAGRAPPQAGALLAGMPVDPLLAAAYSRMGRLVVGTDKHVLMRCDDEVDTLLLENTEWQSQFPHEFWPEHFRELVLFGADMLYRYATAPSLASPEGLQPVVFLDPYETLYALPVASDLNQFFETYAHYVELMAEDPEYKAAGVSFIGLPWRTPELIARDRSLVGMIKEGRFHHLMYAIDKTGWRDENSIADVQKWISTVLAL